MSAVVRRATRGSPVRSRFLPGAAMTTCIRPATQKVLRRAARAKTFAVLTGFGGARAFFRNTVYLFSYFYFLGFLDLY